MNHKDRSTNFSWDILLTSAAFWLWVGKEIFGFFIPSGIGISKLFLIYIVFLLLVFWARKLSNNRMLIISKKIYGVTIIIWSSVFFFYICASIYFSLFSDIGITAFSIFKLFSIFIGIVAAYFLTHNLMFFNVIESKTFLVIGLVVGFLGVWSMIGMIMDSAESYSGLRTLHIAHLSIQDFYVLLWLFSLISMVSRTPRSHYIILFVLSSAVSLPIIFLMNSRMLPFTLGTTICFAGYALRSVLPNTMKTVQGFAILMLVAGVAFAGFKYMQESETRMTDVFMVGLLESFKEDDRAISFKEAFENFIENPVAGVGFGHFRFPGTNPNPVNMSSGTWPHNLFLELMSELGIIGSICFILPLQWIVIRVWQQAKNQAAGKSIFAFITLIYTLCTMQLSHNLSYFILWIGIYWSFMEISNPCNGKTVGTAMMTHKKTDIITSHESRITV